MPGRSLFRLRIIYLWCWLIRESSGLVNTSGPRPERRRGTSMTCSTWRLAAGFPQCRWSITEYRIALRAFLWAVSQARMVTMLTENDLCNLTSSAESKKLILTLSIFMWLVSLVGSTASFIFFLETNGSVEDTRGYQLDFLPIGINKALSKSLII